MTIRDIDANGLTFRTRETGVGGEPVMLLHGFPTTSAQWTDIMRDLSEA
jgi:pimeloyl-ACP methyl ester carboxylesterase